MIHYSKLNELMEPAGLPRPEFSFKAIKKDGSIISGERCICTSSNYRRRIRRIKWMDSDEFRSIREVQFIEFNGQEVIV